MRCSILLCTAVLFDTVMQSMYRLSLWFVNHTKATVVVGTYGSKTLGYLTLQDLVTGAGAQCDGRRALYIEYE